MTNAELNTALYEKMFEEQEKFRGWLLSQPPEEILNHTYQYTIQEDILLSLENDSLTNEQAQALLDSSSPLADIFHAFENIDTDHMEYIWECVESQADALIDLRLEADRFPLYLRSASYAHEHDEMDAYRASRKANIACREAIEEAIQENYRDNRLDLSCVKPIMDRFGVDRVEYVLANTVQYKDWDERFSQSNREWAKTIPVVTDGNDFVGDRRTAFVVDRGHSGLTDMFVTAFRKEVRQEEQAKEKPKRESVLAMLDQSVPIRNVNKAHKPKAMER